MVHDVDVSVYDDGEVDSTGVEDWNVTKITIVTGSFNNLTLRFVHVASIGEKWKSEWEFNHDFPLGGTKTEGAFGVCFVFDYITYSFANRTGNGSVILQQVKIFSKILAVIPSCYFHRPIHISPILTLCRVSFKEFSENTG